MPLVVYKGRTNIVNVSLGYDVSGDVITSEIRTEGDALIATWTVVFDGDGTDGELVLTLDNTITSAIEYSRGLMDFKRVSSGEPFAVIDKAIEVEFREAVTA
jgi:hypothetical protein